MTDASRSTAMQLRHRLAQARSGERVELAFGHEYEGPFFLDRPIHLVGHGPETQLYGRGCPALVVRTTGVRLERLGLADSCSPEAGVCLLAAAGAQPELVDVRLDGRVAAMSPGQLVDLGDILPDQSALTLLEIDVAEPAGLECAESSAKWLFAGIGEGFETTLGAPGRYLLRLGCDAKLLGAGSLALGELRIVSAGQTRSLWVTTRVLTTPPARLAVGEISLRLGKGPRLRFTDGFLLGRSRFLGLPAAEGVAERQALLLRNADGGSWALYQPWHSADPTRLNGQPLPSGARRLLAFGDVIESGKLRLEVEPATSAALVLAPGWLDLDMAALNGGFRLPVEYRGADEETVRFRSAVPWLAAEPSELTLQAGACREVRLRAAEAGLTPGTYRDRSALVLIGKREVYYLDVSLTVPEAQPSPVSVAPLPPPPSPPAVIPARNTDVSWQVEAFHALGSIHQDEWDQGLSRSASVNVRNSSSKSLQFTISVEGDNDVFDLGDRLQVSPHSQAHLPVRLRPGLGRRLPLGVLEAEVIFRAGAEERRSRLSLVLLPPRSRPIDQARGVPAPDGRASDVTGIVVEPNRLDFGRLAPGAVPDPLVLTIHNRGRAAASVAVDSKVAWLQVSPGPRIDCPAGASRTLEVRVRLGLFQQGTIDEPRALVLAAGDHRFPVAIRVETMPR
jgi:hypothetical protein